MGAPPLPFNTAKLSLTVMGEALPVIAMTGTEALSSVFRFKIEAIIDRFFDMSGCIQSPALLTLVGVDGYRRPVAGIITQVLEGEPHKDNQLKCTFTLESSLRLLALRTDHRVILGHTLPDIVRDTCERHGITNTHFDLSQSYPVRPYVVQVGETDLAFIQRLLGKSGITFWSSSTPENPNQEKITFTDHNANCPYLARNVLEFKAPDNLVKEYNSREVHVGLHKLRVKTSQQTDNFAIHDWNENTPATTLYTTASVGAYGSSQGFAPTLSTRFGLGSKALDETERLSKQHAEYARAQSWDMEAHGNVIDMAAGHVFSLDASGFNPEHSGDMIVTAVTHHASQSAGMNLDGNEVAYRHEAHCIKRETPYRPIIPNHPEVPMTFTARIESEGKYATLDAQGRYKLRNLFDVSATEHTQATIPIRRLQPFGGPPNNATVGMHMPLQDGDEVLLSCLNGDPDRPMIVGSAYTGDNVSPVRANNKHQNMIKTKADNALIMDDKIDNEVITLRTYAGFNILQFDAEKANHKLSLETHYGAINQFAKKTHTTETGDSIYEKSGNERLEIVENKHTTTTEDGAIHHQAKTDIIEKAYKNIKTKSGQNTEFRAGNDMVFTVENNATFTIKGSNGFHASIKNGELTINAAKEISIKGKGGGDITFEQSGGGFKIDPAGNVKLYGNKVKLGGQGQVNLIGNVSYTIGGGTIPGPVSITPPLVVQDIVNIVDEDLEPSIQDINIEINDEFLNQYNNHLKLLDDIHYRLRSDLGDLREGKLIDGKITETDVKIQQVFTLEFSELLDTEPLKRKKK
jgi:type VI secretion system secreted protein VgrG